ncbi:MAG: peptidoglycan-binding domain-containing protein [Pseudomonadota bacterium]
MDGFLGRLSRFSLALAASALLTPAAAEAQTDLCANPTVACAGMISPKCLRLGAGSVDTDCAAEQNEYSRCLQKVVETCSETASDGGGAPADAGCAPEIAQELWTAAREDKNCAGYQGFVLSCPTDARVGYARSQISALGCEEAGPRAAAAEPPETPAPAAATPEPTAPPAVATAPEPPSIGAPEYRSAQRELRRLRLYEGGIDGDWGPGSRRAMIAFQRQTGRSQTGELTEPLLAALRATPTPPAPEPVAAGSSVSSPSPAPSPAPAETAATEPATPAPQTGGGLFDRLEAALGGRDDPRAPSAGAGENTPVRLRVALTLRRDITTNCSVDTQLLDGRLALQNAVFDCGGTPLTLTMNTDANGAMIGSGRLAFGTDDVLVRGTGWRFVGRDRLIRAEIRVIER